MGTVCLIWIDRTPQTVAMMQSLTAESHGSVTAEDEAAATEHETREFLLARAGRDAAPILKDFVQDPDRAKTYRAGPLSLFVKHGDPRALRALLFLHAIISSDEGDNGWSTTLPLSVWARVFDTTNNRRAPLRIDRSDQAPHPPGGPQAHRA